MICERCKRDITKNVTCNYCSRKIQMERKSLLLKKNDRILILCKLPEDMSAIVKNNKKRIMSEVNASDIRESGDISEMKETEIEGDRIYLKIVKNG